MYTTDHLIVSLTKNTVNSPWIIATMDDNNNMFRYSIGPNGKSAIGPKLKELLETIDAVPKSYPYEYGMHLISNPLNRTAVLNLAGENISFTEITLQTKKFMMQDLKNRPMISPPSRIDVDSDINITESQVHTNSKLARSSFAKVTSKTQTNSELVVGSINRFWVFLNKSTIKVFDGDTISGNISGYGWPKEVPIPIDIEGINFKIGANVKIRYNGMDSFETEKGNNSYTINQNKASAKKYGVSLDWIYKAAQEAKELNQTLINTSSNVVAISLQWDTLYQKPLVDSTGSRLMGTVFSTKYGSVNDAAYAASNEKFSGLNINKEILRTQFSQNTIIKKEHPKAYPLPLAEYVDAREFYVNPGITTAGWKEELGIQSPPDNIYGDKDDDKFKDEDDLEKETGDQTDKIPDDPANDKDIETKVDVNIDGFINNATDYVIPFDDRLENQILYNVQSTLKNDMPYDYTNKVRIGDVMLNVPPTSIRMIRMPQNEKVPVMRANTSLQKQVGTARIQLQLDMIFNSLDAINGYKETAYLDSKSRAMNYYMDGFRPLLAQFKKAPFLPIDNEYINEKLQIDNVALVSVSANTVEGYPDAIKVTLLLEKFDAATYLMTSDKLGDIMNYPLLRWYYQDMLRPPAANEPWKKHLPTIDRLDNNVIFKIASESELSERDGLIKEFRNMPTPRDKKKEKLSTSTDEGKKYEDGKRAAKAIRQYEAFLDIKKSGEKYKDIDVIAVTGSGPMGLADDKKRFQTGQKNAIKIYGEKSKGNPNIPTIIPAGSLGAGETVFIPPALVTKSMSNGSFKRLKDKVKEVTISGEHVTDYVNANNLPGIIQVAFLDTKNAEKFSKYKSKQKRDSNSYYHLIPATKENITALQSVASYKETFENSMEDYKKKYNYLANRIDASEEEIPMDSIYIPNMIPVGLSVSMENRFTSMQVQSAETPTLQYMGGQEPSVQLSFITDDEGVYQVEAMMRKTASFVKKYRESIVSGFLEIENPLVNLFGIKAVLPENVTYDTIAGQPEGKMVTLTLSGFDRSQRRLEALYGFTAGNPSDDLKQRALGNYKPEKDNFYIIEKMKQQELYPDLQLPRVAELESFLKSSGIDTKIIKWENRTGQVYLDPDFYFSSKYTFRKTLKEIVDNPDGMEMQWEDAAGMGATTSSKINRPFKETRMDEKELKVYLDDEKNGLDPEFQWKMDIFDTLDGETSSEDKDSESEKSGAKKLEPPEIKDKKVAEYFTANKEGKAPYQQIPAFHDWAKWPYNENKTYNDYKKWTKTLDNVSEEEIWNYLAKTVINTFPNLIFANKEITAIKNNAPQNVRIEDYYCNKKKNYIGKYSISSSEFVYAVMSELVDGKDINNGREPEKKAKDPKEYKSQLIKDGLPTYPFQRVLGYMKAIISYESKWTPFSGGQPNTSNRNKNAQPTRVGLMGVDISGFSDVLKAQQVTWGWKRNIDYAVTEMFKAYKKAQTNQYKEIKARAIDWMVVSHAGIPMPKIMNNSGDISEEYLDSKISPTSSAYYNSVNSLFYSLYKTYTDKSAGFLYTTPGGKVLAQPLKIYGQDKGYSTESGAYIGNGEFVPEDGSYEKSKEAKEEAKTKERQKEIFDNLLVNSWDTESQYKSMFTDMLQTDHYGRMVRAFPTFSFYIIDEGKFFNEFRVWDNFYGYNAIQSIDVYKSRKIVADTAIITMSNMYSGLSSKRKDMNYDDIVYPSFFSSVFWSQYVMGKPSEEILDAKKELYKTMMLQTGARVHLRMGYGSDTRFLPTVFNGTITEMDTSDVVQIVCQGDGLELSNMISGSPDDENKGLWLTIEPSNYMGKLLTSKGAWAKDVINKATGGQFFRDNPNGVVHFGSPFVSPKGTTNWMSDDYGEATQNIYSQNGTGSSSQWKTARGDKITKLEGLMNWNFLNPLSEDWLRVAALANENDEDNILINIYNKTIWDIIATYALCSQDYVAAVVPFEFRSTVFFGKPNWPYEWKYDSEYKYDTAKKNWERSITNTHKKTFMQGHIYGSYNSIISNNIKASEEGVYTNVIVSYDGMSTPVIQADNDIRLDKQKTTVVEAPLVSKMGATESILKVVGINYYTSEAYAQKYGHSTVRDFMKDMYKGELIVVGDPSLKPHDIVFLNDSVVDMTGIHQVKAVHHSMSVDSGYYSVIEPDAFVTNFNAEIMSVVDKFHGASKAVESNVLTTGFIYGSSRLLSSAANKLLKQISFEAGGLASTIGGSKVMTKANEKLLGYTLSRMSGFLGEESLEILGSQLRSAKGFSNKINIMDEALSVIEVTAKDLDKLKNVKNVSDSINAKTFVKGELIKDTKELLKLNKEAYRTKKAVSTTKKTIDLGRKTSQVITKINPIGIIVSTTISVATSGLAEMWFRKKQDSECVKIYPLKYKGQNFTAGINGHRGAVQGDLPSVSDRLMNAEFFGGDEEIDKMGISFVYKLVNLFTPKNAPK